MFEKCAKCHSFGSRFDTKTEYKPRCYIEEKKPLDIKDETLNSVLKLRFAELIGKDLCIKCWIETMLEELEFTIGYKYGWELANDSEFRNKLNSTYKEN